MAESVEFKIIARVQNDFETKFGVPRQSGLVKAVLSRIVFEPEYRSADALRGIEGFSHLWLIWGFDRVKQEGWSPTVRPPRLGGNERMGVFATRSPFRPNPVGLSSVRLERVEKGASGPVLVVSGADMADGTPVYDIKPYLAYTDSHPDAAGGYTGALPDRLLTVELPPELAGKIPAEKLPGLLEVLSHDPRPSYQNDPSRRYGLAFAGLDVRFTVSDSAVHVFAVVEEQTAK